MNTHILKKLQQYRIGIIMVFITWFIFFLPILSGKYVYFLDDLKIIYYPIETIYAQFQHDGQLPLWSNEFGFGHPLLAWGQLGFFTPLHLILRALYVPPLVLLQISVITYFLVGSLGMFAFLANRKLDQYACALGAIIFAYCGFSIGHLNHVNFYTSTMLLPYLLIAIHALLQKQTLARTTTLAIAASAIALSGQPQVIVYVLAVATIISIGMFTEKPNKKVLLAVVAAACVAFLLSSFAILPLKEFVPQTERAAGLPHEELFEFSYPPLHTISLIFPYFFGDHARYWGAKGFQELAAYTGIIPLLLAGGALTHWKKYKTERIAGIVLVAAGILLAMGRYSPVYTYLVDHHYITSIGVVGRFVFFFDVGIMLLAAVGLQDLILRRKSFFFGYLLPLFLIVMPFGIALSLSPEIHDRFQAVWTPHNPTWWLILIGILSIPIATYYKQRWIIPAIAAITLVTYGWGYNPKTLTSQAFVPSPFVEHLATFKEEVGYGARIYAAEHIPLAGNPKSEIKLSEPISPLFSVFQPISPERKPFDCIVVPVQADSANITHLTIMVRTGFDEQIWYKHDISSDNVFKDPYQRICFPGVPESEKHKLIISFTSDEQTNMKVFTSPSKAPEADVYFVRVATPTPNQLSASLKPFSVQYVPDFPKTEDVESALPVRHIQAIAGSSSARWIGALSIRPYREFVDSFFANDSDAIDGDGIHALARNKKLVDFVGITHFSQSLEYGQTNDPMLSAGYKLAEEADTGDSIIRLYTNPSAFPKAFLVPNGQFIAADDEIRFRLRDPKYDPKSLIYVSGPTPPEIVPSTTSLIGNATITRYEQTAVDIIVTTNREAFLILTDATTSQWQTFIDNKPALQLRANTLFKSAQVPAGTHTVSFRYDSPAVRQSKILTSIGVILIILSYAYQPLRRYTNV